MAIVVRRLVSNSLQRSWSRTRRAGDRFFRTGNRFIQK